MALIVCPDCKKKISSAAPTCPGCGRPMKQNNNTDQGAVCTKTNESATTAKAIGGVLMAGAFVFPWFMSEIAGIPIIIPAILSFLVGLGFFVAGRFME